MEQYSVLEIVLEKWVPPLISVLFGGLIVSLLVPRWQVRFEKSRLYDKRRLELLESIAVSFPGYIANWRRLMQIASHEIKKGGLEPEEQERKAQFIQDRNTTRDRLFSELNTASIYFSESVAEKISEFVQWDESCSDLRLDQLPELQSWQDWETTLIHTMKTEAVSRN